MIMNLKEMLKTKIPFAVMQYKVEVKEVQDVVNKEYELLYLDDNKDLRFKVLKSDEVYFIHKNLDCFDIRIDNEDGKVYEFMNFKEYLRRTMNEQLKNAFSPIRIIYADANELELNEVVTKTNCRRILESVGYGLESYALTNYGTTIISYENSK